MQVRTVEERSVVVIVEIASIAGGSKAKPEDLVNVDESQLPPGKLISLGEKKYLPKESLRFVSRIRNAVDTACLKVGTRFSTGALVFLVPVKRLAPLLQELEALKKEFQAEANTLISHFQDIVDSWVADNPPEYEGAIRKACVTPDYVRNRMHFDVVVFKVGGVSAMDLDPSGIEEGISSASDLSNLSIIKSYDSRITGLGGRLLEEIADRAEGLLESSYKAGKMPTKRILGAIEEVADKIEGLSFLAPGFDLLSDKIQSVADRLREQKGPMDKLGAADIYDLLLTLSNPLSTARLVDLLRSGTVIDEEEEIASVFKTPYVATRPAALDSAMDDLFDSQPPVLPGQEHVDLWESSIQ